jgi:hypothetical protein
LVVCLRRTGAPPVVSGTPVDAHTRLYVPPVPEFRIEAVHVPAGDTAALAPASGTAILLVVQGGGTMEVEGTEGEVISGGVCYSTCHHGHRYVMGTALCRCIFTCSIIVLCFWARSCGPQVPYARHLVVVTYYCIEGVGVAGGAGVRIYVSLRVALPAPLVPQSSCLSHSTLILMFSPEDCCVQVLRSARDSPLCSWLALAAR